MGTRFNQGLPRKKPAVNNYIQQVFLFYAL